MPTCAKCQQTKDEDAFHRNKARPNGRHAYCKVCRAAQNEQNADKMREYNQRYYEENKGDLAERMRGYYEENKDDLLAYGKNYRKRRAQNEPEKVILVRTRARAKRLGLEFDLELEDVCIPDVCPVLGIPIVCGKTGRKGPRQNSPSIDRLNPAKGYIKGNVRVVSNRANTLKNNASLQELELVMKDLRKLAKGTD